MKVLINVVILVLVVLLEIWILGGAGDGDEGQGIFMRMLAFIIGALYLGFMTVFFILPAITSRITEEALGSSEEAEPDPFAKAHQKLAIGEYEAAIDEFRKGAKEDPENRMPWIEISKIHLNRLEQPEKAVAVLREALESKEWSVNNAAALMFQIETIYDKEMENREAAESILRQIVEMFPETRHSANATHKLREMGAI